MMYPSIAFSQAKRSNGVVTWLLPAVIAAQMLAVLASHAHVYDGPPPANDNICNAITIDYGLDYSADNRGSTTETNEVDPPDVGDYRSQVGWAGDGIARTIWYKFTATDACIDAVLSSTSDVWPFDPQMALYKLEGSLNCASGAPDFSALSFIAANDDADGTRPALIDSNVTAGATYYLMIDGYSTSQGIGTFHIDDCRPDIDGDGVLNTADACVGTSIDPTATLKINDCDTGFVPNVALLANGCSLDQEIERVCTIEYNPAGKEVHGATVSCIANLAVEWADLGVISTNRIGRIVMCGARG